MCVIESIITEATLVCNNSRIAGRQTCKMASIIDELMIGYLYMFRFETLDIWHASKNYTSKIYTLTKEFPSSERFGIINQLRRSANSIPANIAEGSGSLSKKDFSHFLDIALKSLYETVSHLFIAKDQGYISEKERIEIYVEAEYLMRKIRKFQANLHT